MAVYTDITDDEAEAFLGHYDLGSVLALKGIAEGVENSNYFLLTDTGQFILTLYEKRVDEADLPFFIGLMDALADRGIPCPRPVRAKDGQALRTLAGRPACIISFLEGMSPRRIRPHQCEEVGGALAKLHQAGIGLDLYRGNALSVGSWRAMFDSVGAKADTVQSGLSDAIKQELDYLEREWPHDLPVGIIHGDLFPDNVFFHDEHLTGLIDFYFACVDALAYDLSVCLNAWCFEADGSFNVTNAKLLLSRYREVRHPNEAELQALPILARGSALRFLLTRLYDWVNQQPDALVRPKDPLEFLRRLRFHQHAKGPESYGLV